MNYSIYLKKSPDVKEFELTDGAYDGVNISMPRVFWDENFSPYGGKLEIEGRKITLKKNGRIFTFKLNSNIVNLDGKNYCFFGRTCYKANGDIQLPLRFILEQSEGISVHCEVDFQDGGSIYITLDPSKKVSKPFPESDKGYTDYKSEIKRFSGISPDEKWQIKVGSIDRSYCLYLKDAEKDLFYPLAYASPRIEAAWTDDNKLLIAIPELYNRSNESEKFFQYDPVTRSLSPYENKALFYKYLRMDGRSSSSV